VLSGPSGVGKDAVLEGLKEIEKSIYYAVTATTRSQRSGETDGKDYCFVTKSGFEKMIERDELLEWANVYGNYYGVPKAKLKKAINDGMDAVVKVDVQGAATIKRIIPDAVLIFITAPSMDELERRLIRRKTESGVDLDLRTKAAKNEMESLPLFDYMVINYDEQVEMAVSKIRSIITAEKCRLKSRSIEI
jgi:guanylate kinase